MPSHAGEELMRYTHILKRRETDTKIPTTRACDNETAAACRDEPRNARVQRKGETPRVPEATCCRGSEGCRRWKSRSSAGVRD